MNNDTEARKANLRNEIRKAEAHCQSASRDAVIAALNDRLRVLEQTEEERAEA